MYEERMSEEKGQERGARRRRRSIIARERFGADLVLDVGPCAIGMDSRILNLLQETGLREDSDKKLAELSDMRSDHASESRGASFMNYLGLGCIFYDELEG
jgi:hypothetical protein